jgi:hypothetical protein
MELHMKRTRDIALLVTIVAGLAGCSSTGTSPDTGGSSTYGSSGSSMNATGSSSGTSGTGSTGSTGSADTSSGAMGSGMATSPSTSGDANQSGMAAAAMPAGAVVTLIETVPASTWSGAGNTGNTGGTASGSSGTQGSSASGTRSGAAPAVTSYRITLHMDDGTTRVITQDLVPTFRSGDRVVIVNGVVQPAAR